MKRVLLILNLIQFPGLRCIWLIYNLALRKFVSHCLCLCLVIIPLQKSRGSRMNPAILKNFIRISALRWADILVRYALFVMQDYLTDVWALDVTHAAGILNIWGGFCMVLPLFLLFLVDAFLGNFKMLVISSIASSVGIGFISMSTLPVFAKSTGTCKQYEQQCIGDTQKVLFYMGMALIAVGISGNYVSLKKFLKEHTEESGENSERRCWRIARFILVALAPVIGVIALPYVEPWSLRFGIPAICTVVAMLLFFSGWCGYSEPDPKGSPLTNVCRVFVASASNRRKLFPPDTSHLHCGNDQEPKRFTHTRCLKCLEKAAIKLPGGSLHVNNRWRLCTVSEVEEAKIVVRMVPMWLTFIVIGVISSNANTYFVEQAVQMDPKIGKWDVPFPMFLLFFNQAKLIFAYLYSKVLTRLNIYTPPIGIGLAMILSVLYCITAAKIEEERLTIIGKFNLFDKPDDVIPMSTHWMLFQLFLLAGMDSLLEKGVDSFYNGQAPESMKDYLNYITKGVSGLGFIFSVVFVSRIIEKLRNENWFQHTLNKSRLDKYYWLLAVLSSVNLAVYIFVACFYRYKDPQSQKQMNNIEEGTEHNGGGGDQDGEGSGYLSC